MTCQRQRAKEWQSRLTAEPVDRKPPECKGSSASCCALRPQRKPTAPTPQPIHSLATPNQGLPGEVSQCPHRYSQHMTGLIVWPRSGGVEDGGEGYRAR